MSISGSLASTNVGPYRLERLLGRGGMGEVYAGFDERLDRPVALKRIGRERESAAGIRQRFRREARAVARLHHPAIVQVFDWVETEDGDWIVMELVGGISLRELLRSGPLEPCRVVELARDLLAGLAVAHGAAVVHRDLKPANVMVAPGSAPGKEEQAKILDFGLAKRFDLEDPESEISAEGALVGTLTAMSPEQVQGGEVGPRSDLFALGSLLYEMVTGTSAFRCASPLDTLRRIGTWNPPPVHELRAAVPEELSGFIAKLLEKDPRYRPRGAVEALAELEALFPPLISPTRFRAPEGLGTAGDSTLMEEPVAALAAEHRSVVSGEAGARRQRLWIVAVPLFFLMASLLFFGGSLTKKPEGLLYVAVPETLIEFREGTSEPAVPDLDLAASAVLQALQEGLIGFRGITAVELAKGEVSDTDPVAMARISGAEEVMTSRLECGDFACQLVLRRLSGKDGRLIWTQGFSIDPGQPLETSLAVIEHLRLGFPDWELRPEVVHLEVQAEDYRAFLRLAQRFYRREAGFSMEEVLVEMETLERSSPKFLALPLFATRVLLPAYQETRDPALLVRAERAFERAREIAPDDPRVLIGQVHLARIAGRLEDAEAALDELWRLEPGDVHALYQRARVLEQQGEVQAALSTMEKVLLRLPSINYTVDYSGMLSRAGDAEGARGVLESVLTRKPDHYEGLSRLAQLELMGGSPRRAAELYERLVFLSPETGELTNLGMAYLLDERYDEAARRFRQALELAPGSPFALLNLADAELLAGHKAQAMALYERVVHRVERDADPDKLLTVRAQALAHMGREPEAVQAVQDALRLLPQNPMTAYEASLVFALLGDEASAVWNARRALGKGVHHRWFSFPWFDGIRGEIEAQAP